MIESHGTRFAYMRVGPEGQSEVAEFIVGSVTSQILSVGKFVKQGYQFEAGPTMCKLSNDDRSVTLDVMKISFRVAVRAYTASE